MKNEKKAKWAKRDPAEADKYNQDNLLAMHEYMDLVKCVPRGHLRFYDQTGSSMKKLMTQARREDPSFPIPPVQKLNGNASRHYSFFGLTSLDTSLPALVWKMYAADKENKQDQFTHADFFLAALSAGYIKRNDVVVMDNWSAHHGCVGEVLEEYMATQGVTFLHLGARLSHQNPIEHIWRVGKSSAIRTIQDNMMWDYATVPNLIGEALNNIDHLDVLSVMEGDGYVIEDDVKQQLYNAYKDVVF